MNRYNMLNIAQEEIPAFWHNVTIDLPYEIPPTKEPDTPNPRSELIKKVLPKSLKEQDQLKERFMKIPEEVLEKYILTGRPTPLHRARNLERELGTPAEIYFKREDMLVNGSFKPNTSIPQIFFTKVEGFDAVVSQTGAGQWGAALAMACSMFNMKCTIFMPRVSFEQKPYRSIQYKLYGANLLPSPNPFTSAGQKLLEQDPNHPGSVNTGISDALETALGNPGTAYLNGSNAMHTLLHNTIIGLELKLQCKKFGIKPDVMVGCVGGGSNMAGFIVPFLRDKFNGEEIEIVAAESNAAPRLTKGEYRYEHGDPAKLTPLNKIYTLGTSFVPPRVHVGGLRQHGGSPLISVLRHHNVIRPVAYDQEEVFKVGQMFTRLEGVLPAPETCHAIKAVIDEALKAKEENKKKVIIACFSGNGFMDLSGYKDVLFA